MLQAPGTRFANGQCGIASRQHLQSRSCEASLPSSSMSCSSSHDDGDNDHGNALIDCGSIKTPNELSEVEVVMKDNASCTSHAMKKSKDEARAGAPIGSSGRTPDYEVLKHHITAETQSKQSFSVLSTMSASTSLS